jgi:hypothetical protein
MTREELARIVATRILQEFTVGAWAPGFGTDPGTFVDATLDEVAHAVEEALSK